MSGSGPLVPRPSGPSGTQRLTWPLTAAVLIGLGGSCTSPPVTTLGPTLVKCDVAASSLASPIAATGGVLTLDVTAFPECTWTARANASWITELAPAAGQGSARIQFRAVANGAQTARQADIFVNDVSTRLTQEGTPAPPASPAPPSTPAPTPAPSPAPSPAPAPAPAPPPTPSPPAPAPTPTCTASVVPTSHTVGAGGANGLTVAVSAPAGCGWTSTSHASWVTVTSGASGTGDGTVRFRVEASTTVERTGTITIAGQTVTVMQASGCTYAVTPTSFSPDFLALGGFTAQVTAGARCSWTAISHSAWITVTSGAAGQGNGQVVFSVALNLGSARTGTLTVAGRTVTVRQDKWRLLP